jgi:hypothetical protein
MQIAHGISDLDFICHWVATNEKYWLAPWGSHLYLSFIVIYILKDHPASIP